MVDSKRQEALLNEYKGNIFEYLVCIELAKPFKKDIHFLNSLSPDLMNILEQQESFLRNYYPHLLVALPSLAMDAAQKFIHAKNITKIDRIVLVGKKLASVSTTDFNEADILIYTNATEYYALSVKLSKMNSFVNTKSAGIRTIFNKYFDSFDCVKEQEAFNHFTDIEYESLAIDMHNEADIHYTHLFDNWERNGLEVLPGKLDGKYHHLLLAYYRKVNEFLYNRFVELSLTSKIDFKEALYRLMGFSGNNVIQLTAFYKQKENVFTHTDIEINELSDIASGNESELEFKLNPTNFEVKFESNILQVRIKPMNKFTSKAFKVNCSVKTIN